MELRQNVLRMQDVGTDGTLQGRVPQPAPGGGPGRGRGGRQRPEGSGRSRLRPQGTRQRRGQRARQEAGRLFLRADLAGGPQLHPRGSHGPGRLPGHGPGRQFPADHPPGLQLLRLAAARQGQDRGPGTGPAVQGVPARREPVRPGSSRAATCRRWSWRGNFIAGRVSSWPSSPPRASTSRPSRRSGPPCWRRARKRASCWSPGDLSEALALADRIAVMYGGRIVDTFPARTTSDRVDRIGQMMAGMNPMPTTESSRFLSAHHRAGRRPDLDPGAPGRSGIPLAVHGRGRPGRRRSTSPTGWNCGPRPWPCAAGWPGRSWPAQVPGPRLRAGPVGPGGVDISARMWWGWTTSATPCILRARNARINAVNPPLWVCMDWNRPGFRARCLRTHLGRGHFLRTALFRAPGKPAAALPGPRTARSGSAIPSGPCPAPCGPDFPAGAGGSGIWARKWSPSNRRA
jgi:hypothetical protein